MTTWTTTPTRPLTATETHVRYKRLDRRTDAEIYTAVVEVASMATGLPSHVVMARSQMQEAVGARRIVCHCLREVFGWEYTRIARMMGYDHSTIVHHVQKARDLSDTNDPWAMELEVARRILLE